MVDYPREQLHVAIQQQIDRLAEEFRVTFSRETVAQYAYDSMERFLCTPKVLTYVPLLTYRMTRERLSALARAQGTATKATYEVVFVCLHNAARSQMAVGLMTALSEGRVHARSAGTLPSDAINPMAITVMKEIGLDLHEAFPKPLTEEVLAAADVVVTMGCGDACPIYAGKQYYNWEVADPMGAPLDEVRRIRDDLRQRVGTLLHDLGIRSD